MCVTVDILQEGCASGGRNATGGWPAILCNYVVVAFILFPWSYKSVENWMRMNVESADDEF